MKRPFVHSPKAMLGAAIYVFAGAALVVADVAVNGLRWESTLQMIGFAFIGVLGLFILSRVPGHRIGWALVVIGGLAFLAAPSALRESFAKSTAEPLDTPAAWGAAADLLANNGDAWLNVLGQVAWVTALMTLIVFIPLWYPTGRLPSRRWRIVVVFAAATWVLFVGPAVLAGEVCVLWNESTDECVRWVTKAPGLDGVRSESAVSDAAEWMGALAAVAAVASLFMRFRRSAGPERQQIKWLWFALLVLIADVILSSFIALLPEETAGVLTAVNEIAGAVILVLIPVAISIAIVRYRLYEIDRIINRTLVYGLVVAVLVGVFVVGAVWIPTVLPTGNSNLAVAATTLVVFFLFQPLRRRVQRWVDRRFYRSRYDAQLVADQFAAQLRDEVDPNQVASEWAGVVNDTMQPATTAIWMRGDS